MYSRYNPYEESRRIIEHIENIGIYDYVVFYGFGFGYHLEYFVNKFPDIPFSVFEPRIKIFIECLENRDIGFLANSRFDSLYFSDTAPVSEKKLEEALNDMNNNILVIPLTSYETAFPDEYDDFCKIFRQYFPNTGILNNTQKSNEKLHTVNALNNFDLIMNTPNIMKQDMACFRNKPAIIVSAGPSLEYEIENLRYIKENGLSYIFSAASAINTLLDNNVYPHGCWSMDPNNPTRVVYKKVILRGITSIPLIFGTTTGSELVSSYPGNLYHYVTSKDLVTPYYSGSDISNEDIIDTASSVAVVTLLALHKLGFSPIILVGQNLAYKDQRYYSSGIDYGRGSGIFQQDYFESLYKVQSVDGGYVYSDDALNCFRKDMEHYIRHYNIKNVINTTRNGAAIKGTTYVPLDELLATRLKTKAVDPEWESGLKNNYDLKAAKAKAASVKDYMSDFYDIVQRLKDFSDKIHRVNSTTIPINLNKSFFELFNEIVTNKFFHVFLYSLN